MNVGLYESDEVPKGNLSVVEWRSDVAPYDDEAYIPRDSQGGDASAAWAEQYSSTVRYDTWCTCA